MGQLQQLQEILTAKATDVDLVGFVVNLLLAFVLSFAVRCFYIRHGRSLTDRKTFSENLIIVAMTTTIIIAVVKSSLALSLGLVGALSIVRFRTAAKEPEELGYLFFAIAIGVALGAGQRGIILVGAAIVLIVSRVRALSTGVDQDHNYYLTVSGPNTDGELLSQVVESVTKHCAVARLRRADETKSGIEATFLVEFNAYSDFEAVRRELRTFGESIEITFLDHKGVA